MDSQLRNSHSSTTRVSLLRKIALILRVALILVVLSYLTLELWQYLPMARTRAFQIADEYMAHLLDGKDATLYNRLCPGELLAFDLRSLDSPNSRPLSWAFDSIDSDGTITGSAIFPDSVELPIVIKMRWHNGQWMVCGLEFGGSNGTEYRMAFFIQYRGFEGLTSFILASALFVVHLFVSYVSRLEKPAANTAST